MSDEITKLKNQLANAEQLRDVYQTERWGLRNELEAAHKALKKARERVVCICGPVHCVCGYEGTLDAIDAVLK